MARMSIESFRSLLADLAALKFVRVTGSFSTIFDHRKGRLPEVKIFGVKFKTW